MKVNILRFPTDRDWARCYTLAVGTEGKETIMIPNRTWRKKILLAEHSPIRTLVWTVRMHDVPYWVAMHLVRHKIGAEWYVQSQRNDRQDRYDRNAAPQDMPVMVTAELNAQALISISRKRLCKKAVPETRELWGEVCKAVIATEPAMTVALAPDCVYRGQCCEMRPCGQQGGREWI